MKSLELEELGVQKMDANEMRTNIGGGRFLNELTDSIEIVGGAGMIVSGFLTSATVVGDGLVVGGVGLAGDGIRNLVNDIG